MASQGYRQALSRLLKERIDVAGSVENALYLDAALDFAVIDQVGVRGRERSERRRNVGATTAHAGPLREFGADRNHLVDRMIRCLVDHGGRLLLAGTPAGPDDPLLDRFRFAEGNGAGFWVTGAAAAPLAPPDVERRRGDRPWAEFLAEMLPLPSPNEAAIDPF